MSETYSQAEFDEACEIAKREGYGEAVQDIDQKTGGDGEYRVCLGGADPERHTPDAPAMIQRIVDRFEILNLLDDATKTGRDQPDDFFDDKFDKPKPTDSALQSAAREAGWALSELVDGIAFEKRQHVVNIINALSAALSTPTSQP